MGASPVHVPIGSVLAGKYRVDRMLGAGGMGVVVAATHVHLDQKVALKFLLPETLRNREAVERFLREARAAVKLRGQHVAKVLDVGTLEDTGAPYIVMEFLLGQDLGSIIQDKGAFPADTAIDYVLQACEGLAEAHANGIIHRDIKPSNFFLTRSADGSAQVKVLDFGISKTPSDGSGGVANLTGTQSVMGTPAYMSPEQMRSTRNVDARSDIWSIGVVLFELLSGHQPFNGETFSEICIRVTVDPPPPLGTVVAGLPLGLDSIVHRCLEKDPNLRFQSVAELAIALAPYASHLGRESVPRISRLLGMRELDIDTATARNRSYATKETTLRRGTGQQVNRGGRKQAPLIALLVILLLGAGGVIAALASGGGGSATPGAPSVPVAATGEPSPPTTAPAPPSTTGPTATTPPTPAAPDAATATPPTSTVEPTPAAPPPTVADPAPTGPPGPVATPAAPAAPSSATPADPQVAEPASRTPSRRRHDKRRGETNPKSGPETASEKPKPKPQEPAPQKEDPWDTR